MNGNTSSSHFSQVSRWLFQWSYVEALSSGAEQFYVHWPKIKCLNPELNFIPTVETALDLEDEDQPQTGSFKNLNI